MKNKIKNIVGALIALTIVSAAITTEANALTCYQYPVSYTMYKTVCY